MRRRQVGLARCQSLALMLGPVPLAEVGGTV